MNRILLVKMQSTGPLSTCLQIYRYISSSSINSNITRESRFITKIMQKGSKSKKKWYDMNADFRNTMKLSNPIKSLSNRTTRRMTIRNKLFMEHITDQISMGEAASIINGAIEITHVEITPDFKYVNVFWNHITDVSISKEVLQKCAWIIRHELSQLRVIGVVPPIQFVENRQYLIQDEVEEKLAEIESDLKDFEILSYSEQMELAISDINQDINQDLHNEPMMDDSVSDEPHIKLPAMRQDVLGLNHSKIMTQIVVSMSKSRAATQRRMLDMDININDSPHDVVSDKVAEFLTKNEQKELFKNFIKKRQVEERRKYCAKQSYNQQVDYSEEEMDCEEDSNNKYNFEDEYCDDFEDKRKTPRVSQYKMFNSLRIMHSVRCSKETTH